MKRTVRPSTGGVHYERLQRRLAQTGWIALGSLVERCEPGKGGPRYQWTRRIGGKTVTVALSAKQFRWLGSAIANQRKVWEILEEMQRLTVDYMWNNLPSTSRRKFPHKSTTVGM